jgi:hypothetical protein
MDTICSPGPHCQAGIRMVGPGVSDEQVGLECQQVGRSGLDAEFDVGSGALELLGHGR